MGEICIHLDDKTKELLDIYSKNHSISRSSTIKLIVNEFFLNIKGESTN